MQTSGARSQEPGASEKQKRPKWRYLDSDLAVIDRIAAADTIGQSYGQPTTRHDVEMLLTIHTLSAWKLYRARLEQWKALKPAVRKHAYGTAGRDWLVGQALILQKILPEGMVEFPAKIDREGNLLPSAETGGNVDVRSTSGGNGGDAGKAHLRLSAESRELHAEAQRR